MSFGNNATSFHIYAKVIIIILIQRKIDNV